VKKVSIIIVNFNSSVFLKHCIESIYKYTKKDIFEVIIVNNSPNDNLKFIKEFFNEIKIIENRSNLGFSKANNIGIKESIGEYILFLNPDTEIISDVLTLFLDFSEKNNKNIGASGGQLFFNTKEKQESYGNFPSIRQILFEFGFNKLFKRYYKEKLATGVIDNKNETKKVDYITGANIFIKKSVLNEIGFFDEDFFLYYEDTELCYRLEKKGYNNFFIPSIKIIHHLGKSSFDNINKLLIAEKSKFLFFEKCYGKNIKRLALILYIIKYTIAFILEHEKRKYFLLIKEIYKSIKKN